MGQSVIISGFWINLELLQVSLFNGVILQFIVFSYFPWDKFRN